MFGEVVLEKEFEVSCAAEGFPMRPGPVEYVEKGQIGNDGDEHEGGSEGHDDDTPDEFGAVHVLPLLGQLLEQAGDPLLRQIFSWEEDLIFCLAVEDFLPPLGGEGGDGLEAPFFVGDARQCLVAVESHFALPVPHSFLILFPSHPRLARLEGNFVIEGAILWGLFM